MRRPHAALPQVFWLRGLLTGKVGRRSRRGRAARLGRIAMSSPHRPLDPRSGLVLDTHELGRRAGAMKLVRTTVEAPADLGIAVIGVPPGSPVELDLRLESVVEGVLVTGTATVQIRGECVRCLGEVTGRARGRPPGAVRLSGQRATEDDREPAGGRPDRPRAAAPRRGGTGFAVSAAVPADCAGLCTECGANLNEDPTIATRPDRSPVGCSARY